MFILAVLCAFAQEIPDSTPLDTEQSTVQMAFHGGLLQPVLLGGFNAAIDVRPNDWVLSYSHGEGLNLTAVSGLSQAQRDLGVEVRMPWTTGFGIGYRVWDELYVMADFKAHRIVVDAGLDNTTAYTTLTVGGEVGYRAFLWRGAYLAPVVRYWPNVYTSTGAFDAQTSAGTLTHEPLQQGASGLFVNLLVGWAFDLPPRRRGRPTRSTRR